MSDEEQGTSSTETATRMLTAEYKDGQLKIVEVTPYDNDDKMQNIEGHIISDDSDGNGEVKYMQVLDGKNVVVDLLNLTLVRCEDGQESYRLVGEDEDDTTVTCVLSNDDGDDQDSQDNQESYMMIEGDQDESVVFLQSALQQAHQAKPEVKEKKQAMTPAEILEKAKAIQKMKALSNPRNSIASGSSQRGRKRRNTLPPPHELLASPQFKLFLYSCKLCSFKCNAIKELTAHKSAEHSGGAGRWRGAGRAATITLQCARCPYRGSTHNQLVKHVKEKHVETLSSSKVVYLDGEEVTTTEVLVCGACGFEARERDVFRAHVLSNHAA